MPVEPPACVPDAQLDDQVDLNCPRPFPINRASCTSSPQTRTAQRKHPCSSPHSPRLSPKSTCVGRSATALSPQRRSCPSIPPRAQRNTVCPVFSSTLSIVIGSHDRSLDAVMEQDEVATKGMGRIKLEDSRGDVADAQDIDVQLMADIKAEESSRSPSATQDGVTSRGDSVGTPNSGKASKPSRKPSSKAPTRNAATYDHLPSATAEACQSFQVISDCLYGSKNLGSTDNDSFDCECREEWRKYICPPWLWSGALWRSPWPVSCLLHMDFVLVLICCRQW